MVGSSPPEPTGTGARIAVAIMALGFVVLVGGVGFVVWRALRMPPTGPSAGVPSSAPSVARALPVPSSMPPGHAEPAPAEPVEPDHADTDRGESDSAERHAPRPPEPVPLPRSVALPLLTGSDQSVAIPVSLGRPALGAPQPDVTLSLFGDLKCPFTLRALKTAAQIVERHAGSLRFVFYHRPIDGEAGSVQLARRVALATLRGGPALGWQELDQSAHDAGAVAPQREPDASEARALAKLLAEDEELASVLDVRATPTVFVNGLRLVGEPDADLLESAIQHEERAVRWLRAQGVAAERAYALRLRRNLIAVDAGAADRSCLPHGDAPTQGPSDALVTLVEFSGLECRGCRDFEPILSELSKLYPTALRRVFHGIAPRDVRSARRALGFALAAKTELGDPAFWSLLRALRASALRLDEAALMTAAKQAGLDAERLFSAADDEQLERRLNRELALARSLNVQAAPTFFVNGRKLPRDTSPEALKAAVAEELAAAKRIQRRGTPPSKFEELLCGEAGNPESAPGAAAEPK
jgi:protein-disulfide isomerase